MANSHGGARPGAGRKPKAIKFETHIQRAEKQIADRLPWIVEKLFELADGVYVEETGFTGPVIYQKAPDRDALKYLADRIMGKPTERSDVNVSTDNWILDPTEATHPSATNGTTAPILDE